MTESTGNQESQLESMPQTPEKEEASPETMALVRLQMPDATEEAIKETAALFEAIKKRAQVEMQAASELTREAYLKAISQAQKTIEENKANAQEKIDQAVQLIKQEAEKNWRLVDAIKTRAQSEIQSASDVTRDNYLKAVRQAREAIEENKLIEKDRIEQAVQDIHKQAETNWQVIVNEIESIGERLAEAAKNAWNALISAFSKSDQK